MKGAANVMVDYMTNSAGFSPPANVTRARVTKDTEARAAFEAAAPPEGSCWCELFVYFVSHGDGGQNDGQTGALYWYVSAHSSRLSVQLRFCARRSEDDNGRARTARDSRSPVSHFGFALGTGEFA